MTFGEASGDVGMSLGRTRGSESREAARERRGLLGEPFVPPVATLNEDPRLVDDDELPGLPTHGLSRIKLLERLSCRIGDSGGDIGEERVRHSLDFRVKKSARASCSSFQSASAAPIDSSVGSPAQTRHAEPLLARWSGLPHFAHVGRESVQEGIVIGGGLWKAVVLVGGRHKHVLCSMRYRRSPSVVPAEVKPLVAVSANCALRGARPRR